MREILVSDAKGTKRGQCIFRGENDEFDIVAVLILTCHLLRLGKRLIYTCKRKLPVATVQVSTGLAASLVHSKGSIMT